MICVARRVQNVLQDSASSPPGGSLYRNGFEKIATANPKLSVGARVNKFLDEENKAIYSYQRFVRRLPESPCFPHIEQNPEVVNTECNKVESITNGIDSTASPDAKSILHPEAGFYGKTLPIGFTERCSCQLIYADVCYEGLPFPPSSIP